MPNDRSATRTAPQQGNPVRTARTFLISYWGSALGRDEVVRDMQRVASHNTAGLELGLQALRTLVTDASYDVHLRELVLWDANHALDDPSVRGCRLWLTEVIDVTAEVVEQARSKRR